jgi:hypothetical protein
MRNRCGAIGVILDTGNVITVEILQIVTDIVYESFSLTLPADLDVGDRVTAEDLHREHRGLVILDKEDKYMDEGEIWPGAEGELVFVSDHDGGLPSTPMSKLVGRRVEIRAEIYDQVGATRRLCEIKRSFRS